MSRELVTEELWSAVEPLIPPERPKPKGGRPRVPDRAALTGIIFVLRTGIPWEYLPKAFGCSGMTCWRRLRDWAEAGVWHHLHTVLLERLEAAGKLDWSRASLDSASVAAKRGEVLRSSEKLGRYRWVVERTLAWLARFRRLTIRYERLADIHLSFLDLACALICWKSVRRGPHSPS